MKEYLRKLGGVAVLAAVALLAMLPSEGALAQTVTQFPQFVAPRTVNDLGNGPLEIKMITGSLGIFSQQGAGVGSTSGSSTTLTLTASAAATPPCVGCIISGAGITSGTTVAAFNGTTGITLSAAMTVASSTPLAWGMACPTTLTSIIPQALIGAAIDAVSDLPVYTQARICVAGRDLSGGQYTTFAIGAH